ncbi:MAG: glycosyltransferase family 2 protein [Gemmatimonadales bacterium]|nr:MAG: glycosyltransferase family 2 protein [Gemmatimonadales bacterium]
MVEDPGTPLAAGIWNPRMTTTEPDAAQRPGPPECSIIIATMALRERADTLFRAIESVRKGNHTPLEVLVVVNGQQFDPDLVRRLCHAPLVRTIRLETASFARALEFGVRESSAPYFGFLDDDDEYLPGAVDLRVEALRSRPNAALLASNGFRQVDDQDKLALLNLAEAERDPLVSLFRENWLPSCGGMFRRSRIPEDLFHDISSHLEWTWVAFQVARRLEVAVLDEPTFRIHSFPDSQSRSSQYLLNQPPALRRILLDCTRQDARAIVRKHLAQSLYRLSNHYLDRKEYRLAWKYHLDCLLCRPEGWRYWKHAARLAGLRRSPGSRRGGIGSGGRFDAP